MCACVCVTLAVAESESSHEKAVTFGVTGRAAVSLLFNQTGRNPEKTTRHAVS